MRHYAVYHKAHDPEDILARAVQAEFVRDSGFSFAALMFQGLWLLAHRLWLGFAIYLGVFLAVSFAAALTQGTIFAVLIPITFFVLFAFEANDLRASYLTATGYRLAGLVSGRTLDVCERKFFAHLEQQMANRPDRVNLRQHEPARREDAPQGPPSASAAPAMVPQRRPVRRDQTEAVIGLFPKPEN